MNLALHLAKKNRIFGRNIKMLVFDMAGTTINEGGIVYTTLLKTMQDFDINIQSDEINKWHGANKYEVLDYYLDRFYEKDAPKLRHKLHSNFENNLKHEYFSDNSKIELIDSQMPNLFQYLRSNNVKITLNTGYNRDIQNKLIDRFNMNEYIDGFVSSQDVKKGRPYPYMIQKLMYEQEILNSYDVIKIGDTVNDMKEGNNAHCGAVVGVLSGADSEKTLYKFTTNIITDIMKIKYI